MTTIGFVGAGRMAEALIARIGSPQKITVSDINKKCLKYLKKKYHVKIAKDNLDVFKSAKIVILAVKPQNIAGVVAEIQEGRGTFVLRSSKSEGGRDEGRKKLIISIAAGIPLSYLQRKLPGLPIVRAMPNNPCLVGMGITALAKGKGVNQALYKKAEAIFSAAGGVVNVPEKWMDAVTGLSGSGPAFVYQTIEALTSGGIAAGLTKDLSAKLALQTVLGAAVTVKGTGISPKELREMVASPGGTTIEGLKVLGKKKFSHALRDAVLAAAKKSKVLSKRWTK